MPHQGNSGYAPLVRTELGGDRKGVSIDEASNSHYPKRRAAGTVIVPGRFLSRPTVSLASIVAGAKTELYLSMTILNPIPVDGLVNIMLPGGDAMDFADISEDAQAFPVAGMDGNLTLTSSRLPSVAKWAEYGVVNSWNLTMSRVGDGTVVEEGENVTIRVTGIQNPEEVGSISKYPSVKTVLVDGATSIDEASYDYNSENMALGLGIIPGPIYQAVFESEFQVIGGFGYVDVNFTTSNPIPNDGSIFLEFPVNYTLKKAFGGIVQDLEGSITAATAEWTVTTSPSTSSMNISLGGDGSTSIPEHSQLHVRIFRVRNPTSLDPEAPFRTIQTFTSDGRLIDETSASYHTANRPITPAIRPAPIISSITIGTMPETMSTPGNDYIYLVGNYFDVYATAEVRMIYGTLNRTKGDRYNTSLCRIVAEPTHIRCNSTEGTGKHHTATVTIGGSVWSVPSTATLSYAAPAISSVSSAGEPFDALPTEGNSMITLTGHDFGPENIAVTMIYRNERLSNLASVVYTTKDCNVTVAHTEVKCRNLPGVGYNHSYSVTVDDQVSNRSVDVSSYARPEIDSVSVDGSLQLDGAGGETVTITGTNFGPQVTANKINATYVTSADYASPLVGALYLARDCVVTTAHTVIHCTTVSGVGTDHQWRVFAGGQASRQSVDRTSYDAPVITQLLAGVDMRPTAYIRTDEFYWGHSTAGYEKVGIDGDNLGPPSIFNAVNASYQTTASEAAVCVGPVGNVIDSAAGATYYGGTALPTTTNGCLATARFVSPGCNVTYVDNWGAEVVGGVTQRTILLCYTAPGVGYDLAWSFTVGDQASTNDLDSGLDTMHYHVPVVTAVHREGKSDSIPPAGGVTVTLTGSNFGPVGEANSVYAWYYWYDEELSDTNGYAASSIALSKKWYDTSSCSVTVPHTTIECVTPYGIGLGLTFFVEVGHQRSAQPSGDELDISTLVYPGGETGATSSAEARVSYTLAVINTFSATTVLRTTGGEIVALTGSNFGPTAAKLAQENISRVNNVSASYGPWDDAERYRPTGCEVVVDDTGIECLSVEGVGFDHHWKAFVGGGYSNRSINVTQYAPPNITGIYPLSGPTVGEEAERTLITITGKNFGLNSYVDGAAIVNVTGTSEPCVTQEQTHTRIICRLPANTYGRQNVTVTVDGQTSSGSPFFYYEVRKVKIPYGPIQGTTTVTIHGHGFIDLGFIAIRFGDESHMQVNGTLVSSTQIRCVTPASEVKVVSPLLSMNNQTWTPTTNVFEYYDHPVLKSLDPVLGPVSGGTTVSLYGTGFFNTTTFLARFNGVETSCKLLKDTVNDMDVAECVTPRQSFTEAQFVSVNITIDSSDTAEPHFTGEPVSFYHHRQKYATQGPFPPMLPERGLVNATVLVNPEEMRHVLVVPQWPSEGYVSDFDVKVSVGVAAADFTHRQEHRVVHLNTSSWGSAAGLLQSDIVVSVELNTAEPIAAKLMETDCSDLRVWDDTYVTALPYWMEPGTCNSATTTLWVAFAALNVTGDSTTFYLSYGLRTTTPTMNGEAVFRFMDGQGHRWGKNELRDSGAAWSYTQHGSSNSHAQFAYSDGYFKFRGDQEYTNMPRTLNAVGTSNDESVTVRAKYSAPAQDTSLTYVMYISKNSSALFLHTSVQPGVATVTWKASGFVRLYGADSGGLIFDQTANCGPLEGSQVFEWTVHSTQMSVAIGNCTGASALRTTSRGYSCERVGTFWERVVTNVTCPGDLQAGSFDDFYLYSGVHSSNSSSSELQQSFEWVTVQNYFEHTPSTNVTGENVWRLDFSTTGEREKKQLLDVGISFNGQTSDGTLSQFCRNLTAWFQYRAPRKVAFSPPALLVGEASLLSVRSDDVLAAIASFPGSDWFDFPLNKAAYGGDASAVPYRARQLSSLWLKLGEHLVVECSMVASMNLTCPIPSYDSSPASFQFGNISAAFSYDGYHFAELPETIALYRFNATITSGAFASVSGGGDVQMLVTIEGSDVLNVSTIGVKFGDTGNLVNVNVPDNTERLYTVGFTLTVPYVDGAPLSLAPNVTCNATTLARTNMNCTKYKQVMASTCVESTATCPPETSASCKYCADQANYPCYKPAPFGYDPIVVGRCYAPDGTWAAFAAGDSPLYVSVIDDQFSTGPTLTLYDPTTILSGLPSPLVIPSVKGRTGDTKSTVTADGSPLDTSMEPTLLLTSESGSTTVSGEAALRIPEPWSDIGYKAASASPNLLSKTTRMQMLFTAEEIRASDLTDADTISAVQFRYWGGEYAPNAHLYNARLRYSWVDLPDEEAYECLRSWRVWEYDTNSNKTDAGKEDCLTEYPQANLTTIMSPRVLLYDDASVFVEDSDNDEYWLSMPLDQPLSQWNDASGSGPALLLDLSYQVKPNARAAKLFVHGTVVPGQIRTLVWSEHTRGEGTKTAPLQEMDAIPFVRLSTDTVYLEFADVDLQSSDTGSTDSYSVDISLNGGITYIGSTVKREVAYIEMTMELGGLDSSEVGDEEQDGFKEALGSVLYNATGGRFWPIGDLDVSIMSVTAASSSSRRHMLEMPVLGEGLVGLPPPHRQLSSTATEITFRLFDSKNRSVDVSHADSIQQALDAGSGDLVTDFEVAMSVTLTSARVVADSVTAYDPSTSAFYETNADAFYVYDIYSIVLDSLNPASGAIDLPGSDPMSVTLSGEEFVDPDLYGIKNQYARWILDTSDGGLSEWYTTDVTFKSSTQMVIETPSAIDPKYVTTETDTPGYINAYLVISFNGETYTNLDYAVYFTFYQTPSIVRSFLYYGDRERENGDPDYAASGTFSTAGLTRVFDADQSGKDGDTQLYIYINGTAVFLRSSKLVCIFVECGSDGCSDNQYDDLYDCRSSGTCLIENAVVYKTEGSKDFVQVTSKSQWYETLEFGCKMPPLQNGQVRVSFSNNKFLGNDYAAETPDDDGGDRIASITSNPCLQGQYAENTASACQDCPTGKYDADNGQGTSCTACPSNYYNDEEGQYECKACPQHTTTNSTSSKEVWDCLCSEGYYTYDRTESHGNEKGCVSCPAHSICPGGYEDPYPIEGYFRPEVEDKTEVEMRACTPETACPGGADSSCRMGYDSDYFCQTCSPGYYRLGPYCTLCPPNIISGYLFWLQYALYTSMLIVFCVQFRQIIKIGSVSITIRFMQTTYLLMFYDLSWQGTHDGRFIQTNGKAERYDSEIYDVQYFPTFKALSVWIPMFLFPQFSETSVEACEGSSEAFEYASSFMWAGLAPAGLWLIGLLVWAIRNRPPVMQTLTKLTSWLERTRRRPHAADVVEATNKRVQTGRKDLERLYGLGVGLVLVLSPYFVREYMLYLTCEPDPNDPKKLRTGGRRLVCTVWGDALTGFYVTLFVLVYLAAGVAFLSDPRKDGPFLYLCKNKKKRMKKWEFFVQLRTFLIAIFVFFVDSEGGSSNGIMQASFALVVLLFSMVTHAFVQPFKDPRSNALETTCLLANIMLLFLGMIGSIGTLPNESSAEYLAMLGYVIMAYACFSALRTVVLETWDRFSLSMRKRNKVNQSFGSFVAGYVFYCCSESKVIKRLFYDRAAAKDFSEFDEESIVKFVGEMMDSLLPKERNGDDPFPLAIPNEQTPTRVRDKNFPEQEIRDLLLAHAVTKAELRHVRDSVYLKWVETMTCVIYTSVFGSAPPEESQEASVRAKYVQTKLSSPGTSWWGIVPTGYVINFLRMMFNDSSWSLGQILHQSAVDFLKRGDAEWLREMREAYIWDVILEGFGDDTAEMTEKFDALKDAWERAVGDTNAMDIALWFNWLNDRSLHAGESCYVVLRPGTVGERRVAVPSRRQIMLDWIHDSKTPTKLVAQVATSLMMLSGEYQSMIRVTGLVQEDESDEEDGKATNSFVKSLECLLSPTMELRSDRLSCITPEHTAVHGKFDHEQSARRTLSTCFAGDIVRLRVVLRNCFGAPILKPSTRTVWTVYLCQTGDHSPPHAQRHRGDGLQLEAFQSNLRAVAEVLRTYDAEDKETCFLEFMVPRFTKQGEYRIELWKFNEKLSWEGDFCAKAKPAEDSDQVTLYPGPEGAELPRVGETVQLAKVDWHEGSSRELPERNEYTVCAVNGRKLTLDRTFIGRPPSGTSVEQKLRRVPDNANILFVQTEVLPRLATVNSKWRPCEFEHTKELDLSTPHEARMSGWLSFFPGRGGGSTKAASYIDREKGILIHGLIVVFRIEVAEVMTESKSGGFAGCGGSGAWVPFAGFKYRVEGTADGPTLSRQRSPDTETEDHEKKKATLVAFEVGFGDGVEDHVPTDISVSLRIKSRIRHAQKYRIRSYLSGVGDDDTPILTKSGPGLAVHWDVPALGEAVKRRKSRLFNSSSFRRKNEEEEGGGEEQNGEEQEEAAAAEAAAADGTREVQDKDEDDPRSEANGRAEQAGAEGKGEQGEQKE